MKIKWLYIALTFTSLSLLLGSISFIYFDGRESIEIQQKDNVDQIHKNIIFMNFVSKYKTFVEKNYSNDKQIDQTFFQLVSARNDLVEVFSGKMPFDLETSKQKLLKLKTALESHIQLSNKHEDFNKKQRSKWRGIESILANELVQKGKSGHEFLPNVKKKLSEWSLSVPFLEKIKQSIDVSYVDQDKYKELQTLLAFTYWLVDLQNTTLLTQQKINSVHSKVSLKIKELSLSPAIKKELISSFREYFVLSEKVRQVFLAKNHNDLLIAKLKREVSQLVEGSLFSQWQSYISSQYKVNIDARYKRHEAIIYAVTVIGAVIILLMLVLFLKIFPYLDKLEKRAGNIKNGQLSETFSKIPRNEIGQVMRAFDEMSLELSEHMKNLKKSEIEKAHLLDSIREMRKASELGEFSAKVAHELKNPIAILTFCLSDAIDHLNNNELVKCETEMIKSQKALERLKSTAGKLGSKSNFSNPEKIELTKLVSEIESMYSSLFLSKGIVLDFSLVKDQLYVIGPRLELIGAISNLLDNAVEHLDEKSKLDRKVSLKLSQKLNTGVIEIFNGGDPIKEPDNIFNNFYTTKKGKVRGLGLVIVKDVVESFKGSISYSYQDKQNVFTLRFPLKS